MRYLCVLITQLCLLQIILIAKWFWKFYLGSDGFKGFYPVFL